MRTVLAHRVRAAVGSGRGDRRHRVVPNWKQEIAMAPSDPRQTKFVLDESRIPRAWYNIAADLPEPAPPVLHPGTGQPIGPGDLAPLFPMELIKQVVSTEREIDIPEPVIEAYRLYRPSPLYRAHRLEQALKTPAHIYYKYEGGSPSGSHKPNTALPQAFYNQQEGIKRLATETGAGQWGSALAFAGAMFGIDVKVYMVRSSYDQKPYRRVLMETYGAQVVASPSLDTEYGRGVLSDQPDHTGSLGLAISEAIEDTVTHPGTRYSLGSVFDFVLLHQTVIGQESIAQMEMAGEEPDVIIGCAGGGSNFAGLAFPWLGQTFRGGRKYRVIAAEPEAAPSLTRGVYAYDFGDTAKMTPLVKMHTLGSGFIPEPIHAGGLRYHGMSPLVSLLKEHDHIEARSVHQRASFAAGVQFARAEGILPAPEPTHAIKIAIDEAIAAREAGESRVILFNLCGHGHFDLAAYERYLNGTLEDYEYPAEAIERALAALPAV
jgi:tryptophan synthase beta chain